MWKNFCAVIVFVWYLPKVLYLLARPPKDGKEVTLYGTRFKVSGRNLHTIIEDS